MYSTSSRCRAPFPNFQLRLDYRATFLRFFVTVFAVREYWVWWRTWRFPNWTAVQRVAKVCHKVPESALVAGGIALGCLALSILIVRWLTQPRMNYWLQPREDDSFAMPFAFRLGGSEKVEAEWPARRREGRSWRPGTLVLTNTRFCFFPFAWDAEPWTVRRDDLLQSLSTTPAPTMSWGLVDGLPDRLVHRRDAEAEVFALLDPFAVLDRVAPGRFAPQATVTPKAPLHHQEAFL